MAALVMLLFANATVASLSIVDEARRFGRDLAAWEPWVWELSSAVSHSLILPLVALLLSRFPLRWPPDLRSALVHLLATVPFSLAHVGLMGALRVAIYAGAGRIYSTRFGFDGFVYEYRKDLFTYVVFIAVLTAADAFARRRLAGSAASQQAAPAQPRLAFKIGGRQLWLDPAEILYVQAAGNYVEVVTAERTHLVRETLAAMERRLADAGFVRVHRSRLVNPAAVRAVDATPSGDLLIRLTDGREIAGSRRFRDRLDASLARQSVASLRGSV